MPQKVTLKSTDENYTGVVLPNREHLGNLYPAALRSFELSGDDPLREATAECPKMATTWFRGRPCCIINSGPL